MASALSRRVSIAAAAMMTVVVVTLCVLLFSFGKAEAATEGWTEFPGSSGTVEYQIDAEGNMTMRPADGSESGQVDIASMYESGVPPWSGSNVTSIVSVGRIYVSGDAADLFQASLNIETVDLSGWDVSGVTNVHWMFISCKLEYANLSGWDVSSIDNVQSMFVGCGNLKTLDISNWHVGPKNDFDESQYTPWLSSCFELTEINASGWSFEDGTDLRRAFAYCDKLESIDVTGWDTTGVINMSEIFLFDEGLKSVDPSDWDVSKVADLSGMFSSCHALTELDLSKWSITGLSDTSKMFSACSSLSNLKISNWILTDCSGMFVGCSSLKSIDLSGLDVSNVTDMSYMFNGCASLESLNLSDWDVSSVEDMSQMFWYCSSLASLDLSAWDTFNVQDMSTMFAECTQMTSLNLSGWDVAKVTNMSSLLSSCDSLKDFDCSNWHVGKVLVELYPVASLSKIDASGWVFEEKIDISNLFSRCSNLETIDVSGWDTSSVTGMTNLFADCSNVTSLDLSSWDVTNVSDSRSMFAGCTSLEDITFGEKWSFTDSSGHTAYLPDSDDLWWSESGASYTSKELADQWDGATMTGRYTRMPQLSLNVSITEGVPTEGSVIAVSISGAPEGFVPAYQWLRDGRAIPGAESVGYTVSSEDVEHALSVRVSDSSGSYGGSVTSDQTPAVIALLSCDVSLSVDRVMAGETINVSISGTPDDTEIVYQWLRNGEPIGMATSSSYTTTSEDMGADISCRVSDSSGAYGGSVESERAYVIDPMDIKGFAVWSADDSSLSFYKSVDIPSAGDQYNGKTATQVYEEIEEDVYTALAGNPNTVTPWNAIAPEVATVEFNAPEYGTELISPVSVAFWFSNMGNLRAISGFEYLDTSAVTDMSFMFYGCRSLDTLDLTTFDTGSVKNMQEMFEFCESLASVDLSSFDTPNLEGSLLFMFHGCSSLTELDLSTFDTSSVEDISGMLSGCTSLAKVNLEGWDTSSVIYMSGMFQGCAALESVDLSGFDTSKVETLSFLLAGCGSLEQIDLSGFATPNLRDVSFMLRGCSSLEVLDISNLDTTDVGRTPQSVGSMEGMFLDCNNLNTITLGKNWSFTGDGSSSCLLPDRGYWMKGEAVPCSAEMLAERWVTLGSDAMAGTYTTLPGQAFAVYSSPDRSLTLYKDVSVPFEGDEYNGKVATKVYDCFEFENYSDEGMVPWADVRGSIASVTVAAPAAELDRISPYNISYWFCRLENCTSITGLENLDTSNVHSMNCVFWGDQRLKSVDVSSFDTSRVGEMIWMFALSGLESADISSFKGDSLRDISGMFHGCPAREVKIGSLGGATPENVSSLFWGCPELVSVDLEGFDTSDVTDMSMMFDSCSSLKSLDLSSFDTSGAKYMSRMFYMCDSLRSIKFGSNWTFWGDGSTNVDLPDNGVWYREDGTGYSASELAAAWNGTKMAGVYTVKEEIAATVSLSNNSPEVGSTIDAVVSDAPADAQLAYQWLRDGEPIDGATSEGYTVTRDDVGHSISVSVSDSSGLYVGEAVSGATAAVPIPALTGTVELPAEALAVGDEVRAVVTGAPADAQLAYQWLRDGEPIDGATSASYTVTRDDAGQALSVYL